MSDTNSDSWLNTIQAAYQPDGSELKVPDPSFIQPRPLLHRVAYSTTILMVIALASLAVGLGL